MKKNRENGNLSDSFWNKEYRNKTHIALSENPSENLVKFTRFLQRRYGRKYLNGAASVLDLGCGNGRNLIYLASAFGMKATGYDISSEAIRTAETASQNLLIEYETRSIIWKLPLAGGSQTMVLDMMTSHFLNKRELENLHKEIHRVLKPGGWLFWKTFLLDEDRHARQLIQNHPAEEAGSYIHPKLKVAEHVFSEKEMLTLLGNRFTIHKMVKSQKHLALGRAFKRRSVSVYAQKS